jgi:tetratricopeptide (TPR) repeat protein
LRGQSQSTDSKLRTLNQIGRYSLGRTYDKAGRYEESLVHYRAASTLDPTLPNPYSNEGIALLNLGRPRDAIKPLEAAVKLRPNHLEDLNSLGDALADSERYEEGIERYRQAIDAAPAGYFPKSLYSMLHYLIHTCRWKELEEACKVRLD